MRKTVNTYLAGASTLEDLLNRLCRIAPTPAARRGEVAIDDLPVFSKLGVWSWDKDSILVGTCISDFEIVARLPRRSPDEKTLAEMKRLGVKWESGQVIPTYPAEMTKTQKEAADILYDFLSEEFINSIGGDK